MKILYSINYMQRDLYTIEYKSKYLMVYRSSGLNAGRAGRILPFCMLATPSRPTIRGEVPGYIYKEFYFEGVFRSHTKNPSKFGTNIANFLLDIEEFLKDKLPQQIDYSYIDNYKDLLPVAIRINTELEESIKGLKPFDWSTL